MPLAELVLDRICAYPGTPAGTGAVLRAAARAASAAPAVSTTTARSTPLGSSRLATGLHLCFVMLFANLNPRLQARQQNCVRAATAAAFWIATAAFFVLFGTLRS